MDQKLAENSSWRDKARRELTQKAPLAVALLFLLDDEIRNARSLLRDLAPEQGRKIEAGLRMRY